MIYKIKIKTNSNILLSSGEGWAGTIDSDIVYNEFGMPYFPAKRLKGLIRESTMEVMEMLSLGKEELPYNVEFNNLFGSIGTENHSKIAFNDLQLEKNEEIVEWLNFLFNEQSNYFDKNAVLDYFTDIRMQTAVDEKGITEKHSLRTLRVLRRDLKFCGDIDNYESLSSVEENLLSLAVNNLKRVGINRNRGFGNVNCILKLDEQPMNVNIEGMIK